MAELAEVKYKSLGEHVLSREAHDQRDGMTFNERVIEAHSLLRKVSSKS